MRLRELLFGTSLPCREDGVVDILIRGDAGACAGALCCCDGIGAEANAFSAYRAGARLFLCDRYPAIPSDATVLVSEDYTRDYGRICYNFYGADSLGFPVIGVLGGRERLAEAGLIQNLLDRCGRKCVFIGDDGYRIGEKTVLYTQHPCGAKECFHALADAKRQGCRAAVVHLPYHSVRDGFSGALRFSVLSYHGEEYAEELSEVPLMIVSGDGADGVFPGSLWKRYGTKHDDDIRFLKNVSVSFREAVSLSVNGRSCTVGIPVIGSLALDAIGAAIGVCTAVGMPLDLCLGTLPYARSVGAAEVFAEEDGVTYLLDASFRPRDVEALVCEVRRRVTGRLICVAGCVGMRDRDRRAPVGKIFERYADLIYLTADDPGYEPVVRICEEMLSEVAVRERFLIEAERTEAIRRAVLDARAGDAVLCIGKGYEPYQRIGGLSTPYSEAEAIRVAIRERRERK